MVISVSASLSGATPYTNHLTPSWRGVRSAEKQLSALLESGVPTAAKELTTHNHGGASLLLTLLEAHGQVAIYIPGRMIHFAARSYRGDGKTDAKDAAVIADQARMRRDLHPNTPATPEAIELRMLTDRQGDLVRDRTRAINRLRQLLLEIFPALEQAFDYASRRAALLLLTKYQTPGLFAAPV
ncbi:IS110 family transposase [Corynebacterium variabile]|uniref:IS110 family transposase n=1 Tax=Corynebacterium variabile TaxID=1727 RepID=UPI003FCF7428